MFPFDAQKPFRFRFDFAHADSRQRRGRGSAALAVCPAHAFAGMRLRTDRIKDSGSRVACLAMVFKLAESAQRSWRTLNGRALLPPVIQGVRFIDGLKALAA
jgi:hypothetical protein